MTQPRPIPTLARDVLREASVDASTRALRLSPGPAQDALRQAANQWRQLEVLIGNGAMLPKQWTRDHLASTDETARRGGLDPATVQADVLAILYPTRR